MKIYFARDFQNLNSFTFKFIPKITLLHFGGHSSVEFKKYEGKNVVSHKNTHAH